VDSSPRPGVSAPQVPGPADPFPVPFPDAARARARLVGDKVQVERHPPRVPRLPRRPRQPVMRLEIVVAPEKTGLEALDRPVHPPQVEARLARFPPRGALPVARVEPQDLFVPAEGPFPVPLSLQDPAEQVVGACVLRGQRDGPAEITAGPDGVTPPEVGEPQLEAGVRVFGIGRQGLEVPPEAPSASPGGQAGADGTGSDRNTRAAKGNAACAPISRCEG